MGQVRDEMSASDQKCYNKARERNQLTFTVVEQDMSAPAVVAEWIKQNIETAPAHKLHEALEFCLQARAYSHRKKAD